MLQPNYVWSRPIKWFRFRPKISIVTYAHSPQALKLTPKVIKKAKKKLTSCPIWTPVQVLDPTSFSFLRTKDIN